MTKDNHITMKHGVHKYSINATEFCLDGRKQSAEIFLLILMSSATTNFILRERQRVSFLISSSETSPLNVKRIFLLGTSLDVVTNARIYQESEKYQDILMHDYVDSYHNLTYKTLMGLHWASTYCPQSTYVMKTDDDVYLNLKNLVRLLNQSPIHDFIVGHLFEHSLPVRDKASKWHVSEMMFPGSVYPPYLSGMAYVMSRDLTTKIAHTSLSLPFIFLEDVFVGTVLEKLNIKPLSHACFVYYDQTNYPICAYIQACAIHMKIPESLVSKSRESAKASKNTTCLDIICYNPFARIRNKKYSQCNN